MHAAERDPFGWGLNVPAAHAADSRRGISHLFSDAVAQAVCGLCQKLSYRGPYTWLNSFHLRLGTAISDTVCACVVQKHVYGLHTFFGVHVCIIYIYIYIYMHIHTPAPMFCYRDALCLFTRRYLPVVECSGPAMRQKRSQAIKHRSLVLHGHSPRSFWSVNHGRPAESPASPSYLGNDRVSASLKCRGSTALPLLQLCSGQRRKPVREKETPAP